MNIAIITPSFFPVRGGAEQVAYEVARRTKRTNKVIIITPIVKGAPYTETIEGVRVYRFPSIRLPIVNAISSQICLLFFLPYIIKKEKIDIIHMYHLYQLGGAVVLIKKMMKKPLLTYLIGWDTYDPIGPVPKTVWPYLSFVMNNSERVLTSSRDMKKNAVKQGCTKEIGIIPHGSDMNIRAPDRNFEMRKNHKIPPNVKVIFSLQRLYPRKGLEYLLEAAELILQKDRNIIFVIGGKGPELPHLQKIIKERKIEKNVIFAGFIPDKVLKAYYSEANLFVLPSLYEGFGVVYVDALVNGLPVVSTFCGGAEDIVTKKCGILVPIRDSRALADAISQALQKNWDHEEIKKYAEQFNWDNVVKLYEHEYQKLQHLQLKPESDLQPNL